MYPWNAFTRTKPREKASMVISLLKKSNFIQRPTLMFSIIKIIPTKIQQRLLEQKPSG